MWFVGASYGLLNTTIEFDDAEYHLDQSALVASFGRRIGERLSVRVGAGAILAGQLAGEGHTYDLGPGWTLSAGLSVRWFGESDELPFLTNTLSYGVSGAASEEIGGAGESERIGASDLRLGLLFGMTFFDTWSPYLGARAFGGPVSFKQLGQDRTGSDKYHYALGIGQGVTLGPLNFLVDASFIGEQSLSLGCSLSL